MDFYDLGKHCKECKRQDYLPIMCDVCSNYYCKDHSSIDNHKCISKKNDIKEKSNDIKFKCSLKGCKKKDYFEIKCFDCNKHHCLKHRYKESHLCSGNIKKINKKRLSTIYENEEITLNEEDKICCTLL